VSREPLLRRLSGAPLRIQLTLIATLASTIALAVTGIGFLNYDLDRLRDEEANRAHLLARTIAYHSRAPISFGDVEAVRDTLRFLELEPSVRSACVFGLGGEVVACRPEPAGPGATPLPPGKAPLLRVERDHVVAVEPVDLGSTRIGLVSLEVDLGILEERRATLMVFGVSLMVLSFGAALLLSAVLQRVVSKPVAELAETARAIVSEKDYRFHAPVAGPREVGQLVDSFNEMVEAIAKREADWMREIAERERIQSELERRNAEMERFNYTVSHDLKAPLVTIRGFLELLQRDVADGDEEAVRCDVEQIRQATDRMVELLDDWLELSRVGRIIHPPVELDLREVVEEALATLSGKIAASGARIELGSEWPVCAVDRRRMVEVFQNLVENAIKFTPEGERPRVEITATLEDGDVVVRVRDHGIGLEGDQHERIFDLFERLHSGDEGTGIGLALVRRIIEAHRGSVSVESDGVGQGSTFVLSWPRRAEETGPEVG
jgi:signal transduction histidine kinase